VLTLHDARNAFVRKATARLRRYPTMYKLCCGAMYGYYALRAGFWREMLGVFGRRMKCERQRTMTWTVPFPDLRTPAELTAWLESRDIRYSEGSNVLYIPPQEKLKALIPKVVGFYPSHSGFKILKDFRPPGEANYLARNLEYVAVRAKLTGSPQDQLITANYLYSLEMGPRVWDVCCWQGSGAEYTVFVVDHVGGEIAGEAQCMAFRRRLKQASEETLLKVLVLDWEHKPDFAPPHCNGNLFQSASEGNPKYVDFQNFRVSSPQEWAKQVVTLGKDDLHFGTDRPWGEGKYAYQSVPGVSRTGRRDTTRRWPFIMDQLSRVQLDLQRRVVLDIGCNSGMILASSLAAGAAWAIGWDRPSVLRHSEQLLFSLGASRFSLTGADLDPTYALERDIPDRLRADLAESVVFYLSVRQHIGLLHSLGRIPWRALVYEGHQREHPRDVPHVLAPLLTDGVRCAVTSRIADGDSGSRPVAVLLRSR